MPNCMFPLTELHVHSHGSSGRWLLPTTIRLSESMSRKSSGWLPSVPAASPHLSLFNILSDQHINTFGYYFRAGWSPHCCVGVFGDSDPGRHYKEFFSRITTAASLPTPSTATHSGTEAISTTSATQGS
jgi:hypothetical protein